MRKPPVVLCFSGHDPVGGAGVQADIETLFSLRCHAVSVITCLTEQDTHNVSQLFPQPAAAFKRQALTLMNDLPVAAIKIGLVGCADLARAIVELIQLRPGIPVVLDPILAAGGGKGLADQSLLEVMRHELLPLASLVTPNTIEARRLTDLDELNQCALQLLAWGAQSVLITGTHDESEQVCNRLYRPASNSETFYWQRLPHSYHGSGCTLASASAGLLAQGLDLFSAVSEAQDFCWQSLAAGYQPSDGQFQPDRAFWAFDSA